MKISVVLPVFNAGPYLSLALESILTQRFEDFEILAVDDGSTDGSLDVLNRYAAQDARVRLLTNQQAKGSGGSRNTAIEAAQGDYLVFVDADDVLWGPEALSTLVSLTEYAPVAAASLVYIDQDGRVLEQLASRQRFAKTGFIDFADYQNVDGFYRFIFSKHFICERGLKFSNHLRFQDSLFLAQALSEVGRFYACDKVVYGYRKLHKANVWSAQQLQDHIEGVRHLLEFSHQKGYRLLYETMRKNLLNTIRLRLPKAQLAAVSKLSLAAQLLWLYVRSGL